MTGSSRLFSLPGIKVACFSVNNKTILIDAIGKASYGRCPVCGRKSHFLHSYYTRVIQDLPVFDYQVILHLKVRKFFCRNRHCRRKIFSEEPSGQINKYSRITVRAADRLLEIVKETSGRKASFLSKAILTPISASNALRLICKVPLPEKKETVYSHIGVDDWAFRKGTSYGTMLVNMDNGKVIDLLPGRDGLALKQWFSRHAGITLVNRDRAGAYTKAINETLPSTIQIADRFHLVKNFSDTVFEIIRSHYPAIVQTITSVTSKPKEKIKKKEEKTEIEEKQPIDHTGHDHREELLTEVKRLHRKGVSLAAIARTLRIDRKTARKYFYLNHIPHKSRPRLFQIILESFPSGIQSLERRKKSGLRTDNPIKETLLGSSTKTDSYLPDL